MRTLLLFYCYSFFHCFAPITLFYGLMMSREGLDPLAISQVVFCGALTGCIVEIPSGALTDRYGVRCALIVAQLLRACAFTLLLLIPSQTVFTMVFMLLATKESLLSGSSEALLVACIRHGNLQQSLAAHLGYTTSVKRFALFVSGLIGSFCIGGGWQVILLCSLASALLGLWCACLMKTPEQAEITRSLHSESMRQTIARGHEVIRAEPLLNWHILFGGISGGLIACLWQYWSVIGADLTLASQQIGFFVMGINICGLLAGLISARTGSCSIQQSLCLWFISVTILLFSFHCYTTWSIVGILFFMATYYTLDIIHCARYQRLIPDRYRATVTSYDGFLCYVIELPGSICFGVLAQLYGYQGAGILLAVSLLVLLIYFQLRYLLIVRKDNPGSPSLAA